MGFMWSGVEPPTWWLSALSLRDVWELGLKLADREGIWTLEA